MGLPGIIHARCERVVEQRPWADLSRSDSRDREGDIEIDDGELERTSLAAYDAIFGDEEELDLDGEVYQMERTSRSRLRKFSIGGLIFLEQNPEKDLQWGRKAREGHEIMWVLDGRTYVARVMDGYYLRLG